MRTTGVQAIFGIGRVADGIWRSIEGVQSGVNEALFEPVLRIGVTGLARAGKTVFITSLIANLLDRGRMQGLRAEAEGRILAAYLEPQPDDGVPRFEYETHRDALRGDTPHWPASTRSISQLRLSLKVRPQGLLSGMSGPRVVHIDIVDYPGEWLLDLPLMEMDFATWSQDAIAMANHPSRAAHSAEWRAMIQGLDPTIPLDEPQARALTDTFKDYLAACQKAGLSGLAPGRFLMPGDLDGSPALTFTPLPLEGQRLKSGMLGRAFERRFDAYKRLVVKPFFRDHFARIDRQVVLVDALTAIHAGPQAVEDMRAAMARILETFQPGQNSWLAPLIGKRVEKILFAATKADHLHQSQHPALSNFMQAMLRDAMDRAQYKGAAAEAIALASLRATVEHEGTHDGRQIDMVRGRAAETGKMIALHAGDLPSDPARLLSSARQGAEAWLDASYSVMRFDPPHLTLQPGDGPPHIRLDRAADFLIGDKL
ncbi:hypothetical protein FHS89_002897 [Rubricella aquisinus]|uniref:YcjX family protein n=1 Tax=Rubricella aquisinus TaxID=2028108 RepID=A0A840X4U2_9RHOB|nr:hypothetical protein [Rubricella aquisinus]